MLRSRKIAALLAVVMTASAPLNVFAQSVEDYKLISSTFNTNGVNNGPDVYAQFTNPELLRLDSLTVYHWNGGKGASPGTISLYDADTKEEIYSWKAYGRNNNTYWDCYPGVVLAPGSYYVKDSGWSTASYNSAAPGGMVELRGEWVQDVGQYETTAKPSYEQQPSGKYYYSEWAKSDVERADSLGLIPSDLYGDDLSRPITRAHFAAIAVKVYEYMSGDKLSAGSNPFSDTSNGEVLKAYNADIVAGTSASTFSPDNNLTREQAAAMLARSYKKTVFDGWSLSNDYSLEYNSTSRFSDHNDIRPYARESVEYMAANGVISGMGGNMFVPEGTLTKEQAIAIAVRMTDKLDTSPKKGKKEPVAEATTQGIVQPGGDLRSGDTIKWGTGTITYTEKAVNKTELTGSGLSKYNKGTARAIAGYSYSNEDGDHLLLDHLETVTFDVSDIPLSDRQYCYALSIEPDGSSVMMSPDPDELERGRYTYRTNHFSDQVLMSQEDKNTLDEWIKKASYKSVMEGANNISLEKSIQETIQDKMSEWGLGKGQLAGELARYIVSHNSVGVMLTAGVDGDTETLRKEMANAAGEFLLGKLVKSEEYLDAISGEKVSTSADTEFLRQSLGDNADAISKGIANDDMGTQLVEIIKNVEKNIFPQIDKIEKFAKVCGVMKKLWEDDTVEWFYEKNFKAMRENGESVSYADFSNYASSAMHGASWNIDISDLYEQFNLRYQNEKNVEKTAADMKKYFSVCNESGYDLLDPSNFKKLGELNTFENRLNRLWNIRNSIKEIVTVNGKISMGDISRDIGSTNEERFFVALAEKWLYFKNNPGSGNFIQYLVDNKVLTLKQAKKYDSSVHETTPVTPVDDNCECEGSSGGKCTCDPCRNPFCSAHNVSLSNSADVGEQPDININSLETASLS